MSEGLTVAEGAAAMQPPMPPRELSRRLKGVAPIGSTFGRRGRRARTYPVADIMRAHAEWVRGRVLADDQGVCQNSAQEECVR